MTSAKKHIPWYINHFPFSCSFHQYLSLLCPFFRQRFVQGYFLHRILWQRRGSSFYSLLNKGAQTYVVTIGGSTCHLHSRIHNFDLKLHVNRKKLKVTNTRPSPTGIGILPVGGVQYYSHIPDQTILIGFNTHSMLYNKLDLLVLKLRDRKRVPLGCVILRSLQGCYHSISSSVLPS